MMAPGERIVPRSSSACHQAGSLSEAACMHNETGTFGESSLGFTLPRADHMEKVPQRLKAPDFSNSDVQRATLAIHSSVLCFFFSGWFVCLFVCLFQLAPWRCSHRWAAPLLLGATGKGAPRSERKLSSLGAVSSPQCSEPRGVLKSPVPGKAPSWQSQARQQQKAKCEHTISGHTACEWASPICKKELLELQNKYCRSLEKK